MNEAKLIHRFDNAKFGKFHLYLMLLNGSCWSWAAYGVTVIGFILPALKTEWNVSSSALGFMAGIGMLGMLVGSVAAGTLSDRYGRRTMLTWIMIYLGMMFILSAAAGSFSVLLIPPIFHRNGIRGHFANGRDTCIRILTHTPARNSIGAPERFLGSGWNIGRISRLFPGAAYRMAPCNAFWGLAIISGLLIHWLLPESLRFLLSKGMIEKAQKESKRIVFIEDSNPPVQPKNMSYLSDCHKIV